MSLIRQIPTHRSPNKQNENHCCSNPKRAVQIWVSIQHVQEVLARVDCCAAALEDGGCVNVEKLAVVVQGEKVRFSAGAAGGRCGWWEAGGGLGWVGGVGAVVEFEVFLEVGMS